MKHTGQNRLFALCLSSTLFFGACVTTQTPSESLQATDSVLETNEVDRVLIAKAKAGDPEAQFKLGEAYEWGWGAPRDYAQSVTWFRQAAEQGHAEAQYSLGVLYEEGRGVPQSDTQAFDWYRRAIDQRHSGAAAKARELCDKIDTECFAEPILLEREALIHAAEQGDTDAQDEFAEVPLLPSDLGTIGIAVPRFQPVIEIEKPEGSDKNPVVHVVGTTAKGTVGGAMVPVVVIGQTGGAAVVSAPVAVGAVVVGAVAGTVAGLGKSIGDLFTNRKIRKAAEQLPTVLAETDTQTALTAQIEQTIKARAENSVVIIDLSQPAADESEAQAFVSSGADTVLHVSAVSATLEREIFSIKATGQVWSRESNTVLRVGDFSYSDSVLENDLDRIITDGRVALAEQMASTLLELKPEVTDTFKSNEGAPEPEPFPSL